MNCFGFELNVEILGYILLVYFGIIPFIYNSMWQESCETPFIKWYFTKSKNVNWLGYFMFVILGLGNSAWLILYYISYVLFYLIVVPLLWLFEFLFLNKDCSHIVCEDLKKNTKGGNTK